MRIFGFSLCAKMCFISMYQLAMQQALFNFFVCVAIRLDCDDDDWPDAKSDWACLQEILHANYSDEDLVQITTDRLPFDDADGIYKDCIGRLYYVAPRMWWSGFERTTLLTTELVPAQIINALGRRCPVQDGDGGV